MLIVGIREAGLCRIARHPRSGPRRGDGNHPGETSISYPMPPSNQVCRMSSTNKKETRLALFQDHFGLMYDAAERFSKKCPGVERQVLPSGCIRCWGVTCP